MEFFEILTEVYVIRALIASSLVGIMCGTIGAFVVLRNMSLIGDALAHAILPGVVVAFVLIGYSTIGFFLGSVVAGLLTAVMITWIQHNSNTKNDAAIGIVFTAMFALGVMGISKLSTSEGVHLDLKDFLFGSVMGVSNEDLYLTAAITVYTLISVALFYRYLFITTFQPTIAQTMGISTSAIHYFLMLLLSFAVVASLRTVGVILVVAMLITPPSTALLLTDRLKQVIVYSAFIGLLSAILGLVVSILFDTTPGPAMCIMATLIYLVAVIFSPKKGLLIRSIRKHQQATKILQEDIIKHSFRNQSKPGFDLAALSDLLGRPVKAFRSEISKLQGQGILLSAGSGIQLSAKGVAQGEALVRAHRLWETYLVDQTGLDEGQIHDDAERLEHLLTEDMLDEVDSKLGYPTQDPHGSPIPEKFKNASLALLNLKPKARARIAKDQKSDSVESDLWELGLLPNTQFSVDAIKQDTVTIRTNNKAIQIPASLAKRIIVDA